MVECHLLRGLDREMETERYFNVAGPCIPGEHYMLPALDRLGLAEGWMPVFDADSGKPWADKIYRRDIDFAGKAIHVVGL